MLLLILFLEWVIRIFVLIVFIRVILSWIVTEPVLAPIRRVLPFMGGIDLSPLVVWIASIVLLSVLGSFTG